MTLLCECFPLFCSVRQRERQGDSEEVWYGPWGRESYRFHFFTAGLPGSVPLQQLLDCGLHSDALVHPRLICSRQRTACHSCLSNTSMEQTIAHTGSCPRHTAPPNPPPSPSFSFTPQCAFLPQIQKKPKNKNKTKQKHDICLPKTTISPWDDHVVILNVLYCGRNVCNTHISWSNKKSLYLNYVSYNSLKCKVFVRIGGA